MLHTNFVVTARQSALLQGLTEIRGPIWALLHDDAAQIVRGMSRAWNTNNPQILRDWLDTVAVLCEDVVGAWDLRARAREIATQVLALEVFS